MEKGQSDDGLSTDELLPKVLAAPRRRRRRRRRHGLRLRARPIPFPNTSTTPQIPPAPLLLDTYGSLSVRVHHDGWLSPRGVCSYRTVHGATISVTNRHSLSSALLISSSNEH